MARTKDKTSAPKEPGRIKQMWQVFQMTRRYDSSAQWLMLLGFLGVLAGPLVRSSYRAGRLWAQSMHAKGLELPASLAHLADASLGFAQAVG